MELVYDPSGDISLYGQNKVLALSKMSNTLVTLTFQEVKEIWGNEIYLKLLKQTNNQENKEIERMPVSEISVEETDIIQDYAETEAEIEFDDAEPSSNSNSSRRVAMFWNRQAVLRLIFYYTEYQNKCNSDCVRNEVVWKEISEKLYGEGHQFTATQCRDKWKYLKRRYTKVKDSQKTTGSEYVQFEFFEELDELFGKKPNIQPKYIASSFRSNKETNKDLSRTESILEASSQVKGDGSKATKKRKREDDIERRHQERLQRQDKALECFQNFLDLIKEKF